MGVDPTPAPTWEVEAGVVRPYLFTGGRTRTGHRDLAIEAMLATTVTGRMAADQLTPEQRAIVDLCYQPRSVAEVAARLQTPLGVVRVLATELAEEDLLQTHDGDPGLVCDVDLLNRLIERIRAIPA